LDETKKKKKKRTRRRKKRCLETAAAYPSVAEAVLASFQIPAG